MNDNGGGSHSALNARACLAFVFASVDALHDDDLPLVAFCLEQISPRLELNDGTMDRV